MKRLIEKFENIMMAVTFAEAGEHETARSILDENRTIDRSERQKQFKQKRKSMRAAPPE